ncbi:sensor histidine kinase [Sulfuriflexus mobilis]|uniref:sensor histidine kinase n=1 Tax=Sulfuriflexus mobilis TaxID=1811807 RepID=UPI000F834B7B|nr:PAS domain S-box protein [Sulfuriflexus mobilis]
MTRNPEIEKVVSRRKPPFFRRLYVQLTLLGSIALAMTIFLFAWKTVHDQSDFAFGAIQDQAQTLATNIASASGNDIVSEDYAALEQLLVQSASYREVLAIKVSDREGVVFGNVIRNQQGIPQAVYEQTTLSLPETVATQSILEDGALVVWAPIENATLGWLKLDYSLATIDAVQTSIWRNGIITAVISIFFSIAILVLLLRRPMRSINQATEFARELYKMQGKMMPVEKNAYEIEQLEHALNFAARRLYDINKALNDFKFALDAHAIVGISDKQGKLTYVNDRFCEISGYTREELLGNSYSKLSSDTHSGSLYSDLWRTIQSGRVWYGELKDKRKTGEYYWVDTTIVPFIDEAGTPYQYIGIQTDITERKHTEEINARLGRVLDDSLNEIFIFDSEDFHFLRVNRGAQENLGYSRDELRQKTVYDIKPDFDKEEFSEHVGPLLRHECEELNFETVHQRKDGTTYPVDVHLQLSRAEDPPVFVAIIMDITERKEAEQKLYVYQEHLEDMVEERTHNLKAVNRELESFCYSVSHDLRAPLRSIDGFSQALLDDYDDQLEGTAKDYLGRVRSSTQRMGELIDDLLKLSRVVRAEMTRAQVDLALLATNVDAQLRERYPEREVQFHLGEDLYVRGDERLLLAVLENLMGNAWKFTANKPAAVVEVGKQEQDGMQVFYVRDNGAGFDEAYAHKLFEPFQRLHSMQEYEGSGVGLATVQRIVHRHGGDVWAEGKIDQGATVYFTLGDYE